MRFPFKAMIIGMLIGAALFFAPFHFPFFFVPFLLFLLVARLLFFRRRWHRFGGYAGAGGFYPRHEGPIPVDGYGLHYRRSAGGPETRHPIR